MKKLILIAALFISVAVSAQTNFAGTWKLDNSKSKLNDQFTMAPKEMIVIQNGNDFSVEKHIDFQGQAITTNDKYTLDGKECVNPGFMDTQKKSVVVWAEDKKSFKITTKISMNGEEMTIAENYKWDGANLVVESGFKSSMGEMNEIHVFAK